MRIAIASDIYYPMTNGVAVFAHNLALGLAEKGHEVMVICPSFDGKFHIDFETREGTKTVKKGLKGLDQIVRPETAKTKKTEGAIEAVTTKEKRGVITVHLSSIRFPFYPDQLHKVENRKEIFGAELPRLAYRHGIWAAPYPYPEIRKVLKSFCPDVIHLQTAETIAIAIRSYARRYRVPMVATGHAYPDNITDQFKFLKPVKKPLNVVVKNYMNSFLKHSEYATMPTEMAINDLIPKSFDVPIEALSNGVDLTAYKPGKCPAEIAKKYKVAPAKHRLIYVGRVDPEKSIGVVVRAFAKALEKMSEASEDSSEASEKKPEASEKKPEAQFLVVGDGTDKQNLENLVDELGIAQNVQFLGRVLPPDLCELYKLGQFFATASTTETQGIVLIEAAATGLPLVAVDAGAVRELCQDKRNGILCQPEDIEGIAAAMVKLFTDEDLRKKYSKGSLEVAALHDLNRTLRRFEEIYQEAIETKISE